MGIITNASLRWLAGESNLNETREAIQPIVRDKNRAGEIISGLRALAKKAPPHKDLLDLNETINEVIALARSELHRNRVWLETHLANDLPLILGDRIQLQQLILNLLLNAIEAMSGVSEDARLLEICSEKVTGSAVNRRRTHLSARIAQKILTNASLSLPETQVLVVVRDSGPGLDTICEAFGHGPGDQPFDHRSSWRSRLWATANLPNGAVFQFMVQIPITAVDSESH